MDIRRVKKLIGPLEGSGIDKLEIREDEESVRISRHNKTATQPVYVQAPAFATSVAAPASTATAPAAVVAGSAPATPKLNGNVIRLPMASAFHCVASPTLANFVGVGRSAKRGSILYIVEAMKMMDHIEAEVSDTIRSVLMENGQPVEFDQPLFTIV